MIRPVLLTTLAITIGVGVVAPAHGVDLDLTWDSRPLGQTDSLGCDDLVDYRGAIDVIFEEYPAYSEYWSAADSDVLNGMEDAEIEQLYEEGQGVLEELEALTPPAIYAKGHEGVVAYFSYDVDIIRFLGIDASQMISWTARDTSLALMLQGELLAARECPDAVEELGGQVFFPTALLEEYFE